MTPKREAAKTHLSELAEHAPIAIFSLYGPSYVVVTANRRACRLLGRLLPQLLSEPFFSVLPELRGQPFEMLLTRVATEKMRHEEPELRLEVLEQGRIRARYCRCSFMPAGDAPRTTNQIVVMNEIVVMMEDMTETHGYRERVAALEAMVMDLQQRSK